MTPEEYEDRQALLTKLAAAEKRVAEGEFVDEELMSTCLKETTP